MNQIKNRKSKKILENSAYVFSKFKSQIVSRMFWGRSSLYKNVIHVLVIVITVAVTLSGIVYRVSDVSASKRALSGSYTIGSNDLLTQGGSINTVLRTDNTNLSGLQNNKYTVQSGDTLDSISKKFNISIS